MVSVRTRDLGAFKSSARRVSCKWRPERERIVGLSAGSSVDRANCARMCVGHRDLHRIGNRERAVPSKRAKTCARPPGTTAPRPSESLPATKHTKLDFELTIRPRRPFRRCTADACKYLRDLRHRRLLALGLRRRERRNHPERVDHREPLVDLVRDRGRERLADAKARIERQKSRRAEWSSRAR